MRTPKFVLALFVATAVAAPPDWTLIGTAQQGNLRIFEDAANIRKLPSSVILIWVLFDFGQSARSSAPLMRSVKSFYALDCKAGTFAVRRTISYADSMANGDPLLTTADPDARPDYPVPGSIDDDLFNLNCVRSSH